MEQHLSGLNDPITSSPPRVPGSIRRTSNIDIAMPGDGGLVLSGAARDLRTDAGGSIEVVDVADVRAALDADHVLQAISTSGDDEQTAPLLGRLVGRGFRAAVGDLLPDDRRASSARYLLLDDLPVAALISGYARLYSGEIGDAVAAAGTLQADICSGWRSDGTMMVAISTTGSMPVPTGPPVNSLTDDDPQAWHAMDPLPPGAMRRQRLVDVGPGPVPPILAMFRDIHADDDGQTTILHEYSVTTSLDTETGRLQAIAATPHVLPWDECPAAAASALRLKGRSPGELRELIGSEFRGTTTCTHLNDLLRSLADVSTLASRRG